LLNTALNDIESGIDRFDCLRVSQLFSSSDPTFPALNPGTVDCSAHPGYTLVGGACRDWSEEFYHYSGNPGSNNPPSSAKDMPINDAGTIKWQCKVNDIWLPSSVPGASNGFRYEITAMCCK